MTHACELQALTAQDRYRGRPSPTSAWSRTGSTSSPLRGALCAAEGRDRTDVSAPGKRGNPLSYAPEQRGLVTVLA